MPLLLPLRAADAADVIAATFADLADADARGGVGSGKEWGVVAP
ncbi:hypothetical protein NVS89_01715 [Ancylobacter sp. MQZ15Z-1]|uniref:Uncharacterized protein n=1 Tax=Ancylobacter mangrovi TaxID=2972472 RepID=A0A9X2P7S5_9HYPH|nr:hypothetical protein [Ancylobacter mangrovi]MCS0493797.1 hypothetical protein [Ancylobacter mangrovi]